MASETQAQVLSVDEAIARHPNEWIFMQVTGEDEYHAPSYGVILAHHPERDDIQRTIMATIAARKGDERYYVFQAYPRNLTFKQVIDRCLDTLDERWHAKLDRLMLRDIAE